MPSLPVSSSRRSWRRGLIWSALLIAGLVVRLHIATLGSNFDLGCWSLAGDLAREGKNVYAVDPYYNYGPIWLGIITAIRSIQHDTNFYGQNSFHLLVAGALGLFDAAVCVMLMCRYGRGAAVCFFLNPVMLLLTGFHSQVDTIAISLALGSWLMIEPRDGRVASLGRVLVAALLLGLSLAAKHIFVLFPIWIVMSPAIGPMHRRLIYAVIPVLMFLGSFVPFATTPAGLHGVQQHVFQYHGVLNNSLFTCLLNFVLPYRLLGITLRFWFEVDPIPALLEVLFVAMMLLTGWWCTRRKPVEQLLANYLLASIVFAISMADQYLAIPLVACAIFWRRWPSWFYTAAALLILIISPFNISSSSAFPALDRLATASRPLAFEHDTFGNDAVMWTNGSPPPISYPSAQVWLVPLLFWEELASLSNFIRRSKFSGGPADGARVATSTPSPVPPGRR